MAVKLPWKHIRTPNAIFYVYCLSVYYFIQEYLHDISVYPLPLIFFFKCQCTVHTCLTGLCVCVCDISCIVMPLLASHERPVKHKCPLISRHVQSPLYYCGMIWKWTVIMDAITMVGFFSDLHTVTFLSYCLDGLNIS